MVPSGVERAQTPIRPAASRVAVARAALSSEAAAPVPFAATFAAGSATKITSTSLA